MTSSSDNWLDQDFSPTNSSSMLTASFNQDGGCLAVGTQDGFELYNLAPFQSSVKRDLGKSLGKVEMLFRCNLIALVGGGENPYAPSHRVLIWDDHVHKAIGELSFRQVVLSMQLRRDAIAVALRDRVYIYHLSDLSLRDKIYTTDNPHGLLCLSTAVQDMVLACPSVTDGHVRVELYGLRKTVLLEAHESKLRALALTEDGTHLATASVKGTVIRVFQVSTSGLIAEFRRGVERVNMTCLRWSWDHSHLACCSDKGTTHVFRVVKPDHNKEQKKNHSSWYDKVRKKVGSGHDLKASISQIRGVARPISCAFVPDLPNTVAVVGWDLEGNGVLLLTDYSQEEPVRSGYHVISRNQNEDDELLMGEGKRRRKRLMGAATPADAIEADGNEEGKLYVGERLEVLENQMKDIRFEEQEEGFLNIDVDKEGSTEKEPEKEEQGQENSQGEDAFQHSEEENISNQSH
eukprot:CAMPEP_0194219374 /NCGR_PEP_ID=MMETSP0156-20130528/25784_1 /TAXON_ID=33649 /ORGANISM="Thalassionema nitzschioides, Strain L26-B" /LENGTH=461 /DNA_ID=CAMNT_0038949003 /DNA_START=52 /DNA_END=1437 /DNA_ORIENTATION=+